MNSSAKGAEIQKRKPVPKKVDLKILNAVRLLADSAVLFRGGRYQGALCSSLLGAEEVGMAQSLLRNDEEAKSNRGHHIGRMKEWSSYAWSVRGEFKSGPRASKGAPSEEALKKLMIELTNHYEVSAELADSLLELLRDPHKFASDVAAGRQAPIPSEHVDYLTTAFVQLAGYVQYKKRNEATYTPIEFMSDSQSLKGLAKSSIESLNWILKIFIRDHEGESFEMLRGIPELDFYKPNISV
jgi:AbiV family abortive infection protein